ncbi:MAG TPA: hypothetical protein VL485_03370 [Ktedonobacteraceae bacterium]|jgi:hypothetical protein|nr:hypothetical protein [Ktedonobacteraceae bacterium]
MPAIQCPSCGHRHFQLVVECINCGEPLAAPYPSPSRDEDIPVVEASSPDTDNNDNEIAEYERFLAESRRENAQRIISPETSVARSLPDPSARRSRTRGTGLRIPEEQQPEQPSHTPPQASASRQLVRRQSDQLVPNQAQGKQRAIQPYEIYETALDIVPPEAFSLPPGTHRSDLVRQVDPEHWKTDKLPWYFPRSKPRVAGKVILIETKEEIIDYPDLFAAIATLLVQFIWILVQVEQQDKESDRVVMTTIRVQTFDGTLKDSRVRGNMRGSNVSLGDEISLWGPRYHGVVQVRRGFNHTTQAVISTHSLGLIVPALIVIVAFIAGIYFSPVWLPAFGHWFMSSFGTFLHFISTFQLPTSTQKKG